MGRTLVVWRRFGKEHGERKGFRQNSPETIANHIKEKVEKFRRTPPEDWRWWQVSEDLIVEKPFPAPLFGPDTIIYYLPKKNWAIMEHVPIPDLDEDWSWYIHVCDMAHDQALESWVFTDMFVDVIVKRDCHTHSVLDLDDLANAHDLGLIDAAQMRRVLETTQELVDLIRSGGFPPPELRGREELLRKLGWSASPV